MADTQISIEEPTRPRHQGRTIAIGVRGLRESASGLVLLAGKRRFGRSGAGNKHDFAARAGFALY